MSFESIIKKYLLSYQEEYKSALRGGQHTGELSFRMPLDSLFKEVARNLIPDRQLDVILEPKSQSKVGRPDWRIHDSISLGVYGYIEGKGLSAEPFDISPYKEQNNKYLSLGHKLLITDGIDFVFCLGDSPVVISIIDKGELNRSDWSKLRINPQFHHYMSRFFSTPAPQRIDEETLVHLVAIRTRNLADEILQHACLSIEEARDDDEMRTIELLNSLKVLLYGHNDPTMRTGKVFAEFCAQVIMFSLLYAHRIACHTNDTPREKEEKIRAYAFCDAHTGDELLPFRNLMLHISEKETSAIFIRTWIDECILFLSFVQMSDVQRDNPDYHKLFESFLVHFDKQVRFDYGAFYTPRPLANFVVRLTNYLVAQEFSGASICDNGNTIIDPCCGTGSFLEAIIAHDSRDEAYQLCGFEILPAPYNACQL